jgi:hypothetical protein
MDIFESVGFIHYWGLSPSINFLDYDHKDDTINVFLSGVSDIRHILHTVATHCHNQKIKNLNIYVHEK